MVLPVASGRENGGRVAPGLMTWDVSKEALKLDFALAMGSTISAGAEEVKSLYWVVSWVARDMVVLVWAV